VEKLRKALEKKAVIFGIEKAKSSGSVNASFFLIDKRLILKVVGERGVQQ
jgi:hypothetical protein